MTTYLSVYLTVSTTDAVTMVERVLEAQTEPFQSPEQTNMHAYSAKTKARGRDNNRTKDTSSFLRSPSIATSEMLG